MSLKATSSALQNRFLEVTQDQQAGSLTDVNSLDYLWPVMREEVGVYTVAKGKVIKEVYLDLVL